MINNAEPNSFSVEIGESAITKIRNEKYHCIQIKLEVQFSFNGKCENGSYDIVEN